MPNYLNRIRHHTTHKAHHHLRKKLSWYKKWHDFKYHHHIHVGTVIIYIISVSIGAMLFLLESPNIAIASTVQDTKTTTSEAEFNQGILNDVEVTNNSGGEVKLSGGGGPDWYSGSWQYRKKITIDHTKVDTDLTNFPILVSLASDSDLATDAQDDFDDILFADTSKTKLDHEIEEFDNNIGELITWVEVLSLSGSADTDIYLYYGNGSCSNQENENGVWSNNYKMVQHLEEVSGTRSDSTVNNISGAPNGVTHSANGKINGADDFDGNRDYLLMNGTSNFDLQDMTISCWTYANNYDANMFMFEKTTNGSVNTQYSLFFNSGGSHSQIYFRTYGLSVRDLSVTDHANGPVDGQWNHIVATYDSLADVKKIYVNGVEIASRFGVTGTVTTNPSGTSWIGTYGGGVGYPFNGLIDEVRISNIARSSEWISASHNNQNSPSTFYSLGTEESALSPSGTWTSSPTVDSGIIDLYWNGGWGSPNGFEIDTNIEANTSISFEIRSSDTGGADINWSTWQNLGTIDSGGGTGNRTFVVTQGNMPNGTDLPIGTNRYIQLRATLTSSDGIGNPTVKEFRLVYMADQNAPTNPDTISVWDNGQKNASLSDDNWYNYETPYFEWSGATDGVGESGIEGYWVYFGTDNTADPMTAGSWQTGSSYEASIQEADSGETFYLCISTEDYAENRYTNGAPDYFKVFTYKFDKTKPQNPSYITVSPVGWSTTNDFDFTWPAGSDPLSNGDASGIYGYQYKRAGGGDDWSATITDTFANDLEAYQNGQNTFYVRSVDIASNIASGETQVYYYYNADAPSAPQNLGVVPPNSTTNAFTFSWTEPVQYNGNIKGYYYSVNSLPNDNNTTYTTQLTTGEISAATQQGFNTLYVAAMDNSDNINWGNYASIQFECNTSAPGIPLNPEIFDTSNRDLQKYSVALNWEEPEDQGVGFAGYIIERSTDGADYSQVGTSSSTSYIDVNLESILYYYRIKAKDNSNNISAPSTVVSITPTGRYTSPPDITISPELDVKVSTAMLRWVTDREASSFVEIGEDVNYGLTQGQFEFVTDHKVTIERLKPDTIYHYRVKYVDDDGNIGYSADATFKTEPAPRVTNVSISDIRLYSTVISWNTTAPAQASILYGKSSSYGALLSNISGGYTTSHTVRLDDLDHSSTYHFAITILDIDENEVLSDDYSFETLKFPVVSNVRMEPLGDQATATMKFTWETNVSTNSIIEYAPEGGVQQESAKSKLETAHEVTISNLMDNTFYTLKIKGRDQFGNEAVSDTQSFKTDYDTRPPKVSNISTETSVVGVGLETRTQMTIYWETDESSTSQIEYGIGISGDTYSNKSSEDAVLSTSHIVVISDLKPSTAYHFRAVSRDASSNKGFSEDSYILTEQASESVIEIIFRSLEKAIGWIFRI